MGVIEIWFLKEKLTVRLISGLVQDFYWMEPSYNEEKKSGPLQFPNSYVSRYLEYLLSVDFWFLLIQIMFYLMIIANI